MKLDNCIIMDAPQAPGGGGGLAGGQIRTVLEGEIKPPPRPPKPTVGECMINDILAGAGLNALLLSNRIGGT
jgi:hypothetical protein